jgi:son of sevenless-like protein
VNTQTGQQSRDLPHETDGDISDTDLSTFSVRNGSHNGSSVALNGMTQPESDNYAGFGALRRSGTPEPWARCLADDGLAYYYRNKKTGEMRWTLPEANSSDNETGAMPSIASKSSVSLSSMNSDFSRDQDTFAGFRSETSPSRTKGTSLDDRDSVISDDSDIHPNAQDGAAGLTPLQRSIQQARRDGTLELTAAEQAAQALQQAMAPPLPQSIAELTADVQSAIAAVVDFAQQPDLAGNPVHLEGMNARVSGVIDAVRDLLYIAALPSGSLPADLLKEGGDARSTLAASNLQTQLKPAQRKVTATLSKLVLSTRAFRSDSESPIPEATARLEADALELDKALQAFVMDVHRFQRHSRIGVKRVRGVFSSDKIGLGLYGGGSAGSWKGFGWGVLEKETEPPSMPLGTDVVESLRQPVERLSVQLASFSTLVKTADGSTSKSFQPLWILRLTLFSDTPRRLRARYHQRVRRLFALRGRRSCSQARRH